MTRSILKVFKAVWGIYALVVFLLLSLSATAAVAILPGLERRRRVARGAARLIFRLWGMPLEAVGDDLLPDDACVVVSNHASYLDGIILTATLPARFAFVIKKEMNDVPFAGLLLRRIGSEFVERTNQHRGAMDARRLLRKAHNGDALAFFPEGTFDREPGLRRFRSGAFVAAARAGLPVVPVIITGARNILPDETILPRPGRIRVRVTAPLAPAADRDNGAAQMLNEASRRRILEFLGEPDLAAMPCPAAEAEAEAEAATLS